MDNKTIYSLPSTMKPSGTFCIQGMSQDGPSDVTFTFDSLSVTVPGVAFHGGEGELSADQVQTFAQQLLKQLTTKPSSMSLKDLKVGTTSIKPLPAFQVEFQDCGDCGT